MQVVGRPFDDATVLRVAHAYEKATPWRAKRPRLEPSDEFSTALPPVPEPNGRDSTVADPSVAIELSDRRESGVRTGSATFRPVTMRRSVERSSWG